MKGAIRTKAKCPRCGGAFENIEDRDLMCRKCLISPQKFYIDLFWKRSQRKIFSDKRGISLKSYSVANSTLIQIREEIDNHTFDPVNYRARNNNFLQFEVYVKSFFNRMLDAHQAGKYSPTTIPRFKSDIFIHLIPYFKKYDIRDIRSNDLEDFYSNLPGRLAPATQKHIFMTLRIIMRTAFKRKDISILPDFPSIEVPEPQTRWIDEATQEKIFEKIPDVHKPIFLFMMKQGVRPGEARALHWEDINEKQKTVEIHRTFAGTVCLSRTKTKRIRKLPLDDKVYDDLLRPGLGNSGFVFTTNRGAYRDGTALNRIWNKAVKDAGLPHIKLYEGTRHSFSTQCANAGVDSFQLQTFAGHTSSLHTQRYVHINMDGLQMVLDKKNRNI